MKRPVTTEPTSAPHLLQPGAVYSVEQARAALSLRRSTIRREVRAGRLRISKRAGRYFLLGAWLLEWIEGGEVKRNRNRTGAAAEGDMAEREVSMN